jgi:hypothetical protein
MQKIFTVLLALALPGTTGAASTKIALTIAAGKHDRVQEPVCVVVQVPAECAGARRATVEDAQGKPFAIGQVTMPGLRTLADGKATKPETRELHFILPELKAGQTLALQATLTTAGAKTSQGPEFAWTNGPETDELRLGDRPVLRYVHPTLDDSTPQKREQTFKVYHHVYDPTGQRLVTKGVGGLYTHHRGLFYGFMKVTYDGNKVVDIWHCKEDTHQSHEKTLAAETGPVLGRHRLLIAWHGKGKEVFAHEERELTVYNVPGGLLIDFASTLTPVNGPIKLDGDPQHAGFHFRADNEVADKTKKQTIFIRPDGADRPGATRNWPQDKGHVNLPWDAMSFVLGGQRYTVAYLDGPTNPKEARFSERDYGRFGSYFVKEVERDKPLTVAYRVWLQEGPMTVDQVAAKSAAFVGPVEGKGTKENGRR